MVVGKVGEWIGRLAKGKAVILTAADLQDSAKAHMTSNIYDQVRPEYIKAIVDEVNSDEYPGYSLWERPDGRWTLERE